MAGLAIPFPIGEQLATALPHALFVTFPDGGHLLPVHCAAVRAAVADILDLP